MDTPLGWMLACHDRIRAFMAGLRRLSVHADWADPRATDGARQVARYLREALPRHGEDEDQSLAPRLLALALPAEVRDEIARMTAEHQQMDAQLPALLLALDGISAGAWPERAAFQRHAQVYADLLLDHVGREERVIFPWVSALGPQDELEMIVEMQARRGVGGWKGP